MKDENITDVREWLTYYKCAPQLVSYSNVAGDNTSRISPGGYRIHSSDVSHAVMCQYHTIHVMLQVHIDTLCMKIGNQ